MGKKIIINIGLCKKGGGKGVINAFRVVSTIAPADEQEFQDILDGANVEVSKVTPEE